jgi:hypothetical protein
MSSGTVDERRVIQRRSGMERRLGERRSPERATAGRRVMFENDRRSGTERRA